MTAKKTAWAALIVLSILFWAMIIGDIIYWLVFG